MNHGIISGINHLDANFEDTKLNNVVFRDCELSKTRFKYCIFNSCELSSSYWDTNKIPEHFDYNDNLIKAEVVADTYKRIKKCLQEEGAYNKAGDFYINEMNMLKKGSNSISTFIFYNLLSYICGYGEKPRRAAFWFFFVIIFFGILFWFLNCLIINPIGTTYSNFIMSIVYSALTSVTLSYDYIQPKPGYPVILSMIEAGITTFLIAIFVFVFARKMSR